MRNISFNSWFHQAYTHNRTIPSMVPMSLVSPDFCTARLCWWPNLMRSLPTIRMRGTCQRCPWTVRSCCWSSSSPISWQGHPDLTWPGHLVYQSPDIKKNDHPNLALDDVGRHPISVMKTPCWLVVWNMTVIFHNIWNNPSYWLSYYSRWLLHRQPACATIKIMGISGHNWRSQPGCFTIDQRLLQTPMCFFPSHTVGLVTYVSQKILPPHDIKHIIKWWYP